MFKQTPITNFFQKLPNAATPQPKTLRLRQALITDFYGAEAEKRKKIAAKKAYRDRYKAVRRYRKQFHKEHSYWQLLGSKNCLCYCQNNLSFFVVDPRIDETIAELDLDDDFWLEHIHVNSAYQRQGIGTQYTDGIMLDLFVPTGMIRL